MGGLSDAVAGVLQILTLALVLVLVHRPLGGYIAWMFQSTQRLGRRARLLPPHRRQLVERADLARLPPRRADLLGRRRGLRLRHPEAAGGAALLAGLPVDPVGPVVQHGSVVRDQHELAVVLARRDDGLRRAARRPRRAELRLGGRRPRRRDRSDPRALAGQVGHPRQLLGRPDPRHHPPPAAPRDHRGVRAARRRRDPELQRVRARHHPHRLVGRDPGRPGGLAGGDQRARQQRRRLLQRQLGSPVREPHGVDEPLRDPADARDPVLAASHVRHHGRRQAPGPRDHRRDGHALRRIARRHDRVRALGRGHRDEARRRRDGGQRGPLRHLGARRSSPPRPR